MIDGKVMRIDPGVLNGTVTVDVELAGALPLGARPDLSVDGTIDLDRMTDVLFVGRPAFGNENSTISLFKLGADGKTAVRVPVKVGRASVNSIQVLEGLQEGDTVILSDMSRWDNTDRDSFELGHGQLRKGEQAMTTTETIIQIEDLTKIFYTDEIETHALSGVHLSINRGEYVAMSGPSGCGKSTLLSIIGLLDTPTDGRYSLNGKEVANLNFADRSRIRNQEIGFIFQSFNLIGDLTVAENVELPLTYRAGMPSAERKKRVQESLERVNMAHRMRHYPAQLSGGQQQRVAVARALAGSPSILLADEPTGNLDSKNGEAVMKLLQELHQEGATICMVTHDPRFAAHAERQIHLFDGKVVAEGELNKLLAEVEA